MTLKCSVFIATSLDGYIAGPNGELDWLNTVTAPIPKGEDCGFQKFLDSIDVLVMGRNTFEKVISFGKWPYKKTPVIVLSSGKLDIPKKLSKTVSHSSETPRKLYNRLSKEKMKRLYIDGGITIQRFLKAGLIKDITITIIPILLGKGIPLFGNLKKNKFLKLLTSKKYDFGFLQLTYGVK